MKTITMKFIATLLIGGFFIGGLTGCENLSKAAKGAGIGAGAGAVIGGVIGNQSGNTGRGAAIGGAVGAAVGAIIGDQMDRQAAELKKDLPDAVVVRDGDGIQVTFASAILFGFDSTNLAAAAKPDLNDLATSMNKNTNTELQIIGHTDSVGSDSYNQRLSENRAKAVANYLASQGVSSSRMATLGKGESEPVADNSSDAGRAQNRRVQILINVTEAYRQQLIQQQQASGNNGR
jgi:outer membrane protein OmpA-like peptidoglycan-associated protein